MPGQYDVFISYASEDHSIASALKRALEGVNLKVWHDVDHLTLGQGVPDEIDKGLSNSRYAVTILSNTYLRKDWTTRELNSMLGRDAVLPVLYGITREDVTKHSAMLGRLKSVSWDDGLALVVDAIKRRVLPDAPAEAGTVAIDVSHDQHRWDYLEDAIEELSRRPMRLIRPWIDDDRILQCCRVLIMPLPFHKRLDDVEMNYLKKWVERGKGLFMLGHYGERHHDANMSRLGWRFDLEFADNVVLPSHWDVNNRGIRNQ